MRPTPYEAWNLIRLVSSNTHLNGELATISAALQPIAKALRYL